MLGADGALDGQPVVMAPQDERLVEFDQRFAEQVEAQVGVGLLVETPQRAHQQVALGLVGLAVGLEQTGRHLVALRLQQAVIGGRQRWAVQAGLQAPDVVRPILEHPQILRVSQARPELDLAELDRLKAAGRAQAVAKLQELCRGHRLEDVDLFDQELHHFDHPVHVTESFEQATDVHRAMADSISCRISLNHSS